MKTIILTIIAITAYNNDPYYSKCTAVNLETGDTGTLYIAEGCIMEGDTIHFNYEDKK